MAHDFHWLLAMHTTAARFGDGLKPELAARLGGHATRFGPDVRPLGRVPVSAGPADQFATKAQLAKLGIPSIAPAPAVHADLETADST